MEDEAGMCVSIRASKSLLYKLRNSIVLISCLVVRQEQ